MNGKKIGGSYVILLWLLLIGQTHAKLQNSVIKKVHNLNLLSTDPEYERIFTPNHINGEYHHRVHITDEFGKFMKLEYKAKHPQNATILKLDETHHKSNIKSLQCNSDNDNTIKLHFISPHIMSRYYEEIEAALRNANKDYFIVAGHEWKCMNPYNYRHESVLRKVVKVYVNTGNENTLILSTQKASLVDIFEQVDIDYKTNVGIHSVRLDEYDIDTDNGRRRRLLASSWYDSVWPSITESISAVYDRVVATVNKIESIVMTVGKLVLGEPVEFTKDTTHSWKWNYDDDTKKASNTFDVSGEVGCTDCFAYTNLEYSYKLKINNYKVEFLSMILEGDAKMNIDITVKQRVDVSQTLPTPEIPIPDFSFSVAGVKFGIFISGEMIIELTIESESFAFQLDAGGYIKKGMEYNGIQGTQIYINEHNFDYHKTGPKLAFQSVNVIIAAHPILYLTLEHVGSVFFGIKVTANLEFAKNSTANCGLYLTPSVSSQTFIGVNSTLIPWYKSISLRKHQSTLTDWSGCISKSKLTQIQTVESEVTYYPYSTWSNYNWSDYNWSDYNWPNYNWSAYNWTYYNWSNNSNYHWDNYTQTSLPDSECSYINIDSNIYPIGEYFCSLFETYSYFFECIDNAVYINMYSGVYCEGSLLSSVNVYDYFDDIRDFNCDGSGDYCDVTWTYIHEYYDPSVYNVTDLETLYKACIQDLNRTGTYSEIPYVIGLESNGTYLYCDNGFLYQSTYSSDEQLLNININISNGYVECMYACGEAFHSTATPTTTKGRRRRIQEKTSVTPKPKTNATAFIDISDINNNDIITSNGWGTPGSSWWSNMTSIPGICDDWIITCGSDDNNDPFPVISPNDATLSISVRDNETLIGIYHTIIEITPESGWDLTNVTIYTNVSCIARHEFNLVYDNDDIPTYAVDLLEWKCDTDLDILGINTSTSDAEQIYLHQWECMISLPMELNALQLDSSFGNIMLFDRTWCNVYSMTRKPEYVIDPVTIANIHWDTFQYPSSLWYGLWNCHDNISTNTELYFLSYNHTDGYIDAVMHLETLNDSFFLDGTVDLENMTMILDLAWFNESYRFIGILKVLYDGTMTYSGSIDQSGCTGFVFQGYLNMTQFDYNMSNQTNMTTHRDEDVFTSTTSTLTSTISLSQSSMQSESTVYTPTLWITESFNKDNDRSTTTNAMLSTGGMIMFIIGMASSSIITAVVFIVRVWYNKRKTLPAVQLALTNDASL